MMPAPLLLQTSLPPGPGNIWFPIAFVLIMMFVAALVAAGGDRMGHRAARRKLRIGKLRPRHVSTLIAVVTGMLISLVTFGVVFVVWSDFRNALLQYDNLNENIKQLNAEIDSTKGELATVEAAYGEAQQKLAVQSETLEVQSEELAEKTAAITDVRAQFSEAQSELQRNQARLREMERRRDELQRQIPALQKQIEDAIDIEAARIGALRDEALAEIAELNRQIDALHGEIARAETGQQLIAVGAQLGHVEVPAARQGELEAILEQELTEINAELTEQGLEFAPETRDELLSLLARELDPQRDYLVVIRASSNVFAGDRVPLHFELQPVSTLVRAGEPVLDILITADTARIIGLQGITREVSVPAQFDRGSLIDFAVEAQDVFSAGARAAGFIPGKGGNLGSPVERLVDVSDELIQRQRPVRIQFVAKHDATATDSLADAELYLSQPGARQQTQPPAPEPESQAEDATDPEDAEDAGAE